MQSILPDLLRSVASDAMTAILISSLARSKYRYLHWIVLAALIFADTLLEIRYYLVGDYDRVVIVNLSIWLAILFFVRFFYRESFMQWCFNVLTTMLFFIMAVFISYHLSDLLPYSVYANTVIRVLLLGGTARLFRHTLRPVYQSVLEHWDIYILPIVSLLGCFIYLYTFTGGVEKALTEQAGILGFLCVATVCVYVAIFRFLNVTKSEETARESAIRAQQQQKLLQNELNTYDAFVETAKQNRHDMRHHDSLILQYLEQGDVQEAQRYIKSHQKTLEVSSLHEFCKNKTANAVLRLYERRAMAFGISFKCEADIPALLKMPDPEFGGMLSNLLENATEACEHEQEPQRSIVFNAHTSDGRLLIQLSNTAHGKIAFKNGLPVSTKREGGIGTTSVLSFANTYGGLVDYTQRNGEFIVRLILPL